jgi:hypothetical protein
MHSAENGLAEWIRSVSTQRVRSPGCYAERAFRRLSGCETSNVCIDSTLCSLLATVVTGAAGTPLRYALPSITVHVRGMRVCVSVHLAGRRHEAADV